jgi:anti-anti-sigma factor
MEIKDTLDDGIVIIQPAGRLDSTSSPEFERFLLAKITDRSRLIVDLSKLDYISSAGLRVILVGAKRSDSAKGKILLCGMKDIIHQIFEVSGFLKILKVEKNLSKAKQAIKR